MRPCVTHLVGPSLGSVRERARELALGRRKQNPEGPLSQGPDQDPSMGVALHAHHLKHRTPLSRTVLSLHALQACFLSQKYPGNHAFQPLLNLWAHDVHPRLSLLTLSTWDHSRYTRCALAPIFPNSCFLATPSRSHKRGPQKPASEGLLSETPT